MANGTSVGQYLIRELHRRGVEHLFGVPGDYVLGFYEMVRQSPIQLVGATREDCAGFAADGYARLRGMGAVCVTYCVGGLSAANSIAGAFAEKSPVVVISGAPGMAERANDPLLHHRVREFSTQADIFRHLTVASASLEDPHTACQEIDRVLHAVERYRRPGYIELPRDRVALPCRHCGGAPSIGELTDRDALKECMAEVVAMVNAARRPVILAGEEVHRFGLQEDLQRLVEKTRIPVATTVLGKSVISDLHPLCLGVYEGAMGRAEVQRAVESADCLLMLGCFMTDMNLGIYTADLDPRRTIYATSEKVSVRRHQFANVPFRSLFRTLLQAPLRRRERPAMPRRKPAWGPPARPDARVSIRSLFQTLNNFLTAEMVVIADVGDALFGSIDLAIHRSTEFLSPAYYTSMGFAVPASIGAQLADPKRRPLVLVGDGAFQMTGLELSTSVRLGLNPIVVVLNNHGYGTERMIQDGPYNDLTEWNFCKLPDLLGAGRGHHVDTVAELRRALDDARTDAAGFNLIEVNLDPYDTSPALKRLGERLGKKVKANR